MEVWGLITHVVIENIPKCCPLLNCFSLFGLNLVVILGSRWHLHKEGRSYAYTARHRVRVLPTTSSMFPSLYSKAVAVTAPTVHSVMRVRKCHLTQQNRAWKKNVFTFHPKSYKKNAARPLAEKGEFHIAPAEC